MKIIYSLKDRKPFVQALEEITGTKAVYKKPPTFAYEVGCMTITRDGNLEFDDNVDADSMKDILSELEQRGFVAKENPYLKTQVNLPEEKETSEEEQLDSGNQEEASEKEDIGLTVSMPRKYFNDQALARLKNLVTSKQTLIKKALGIEELPIKVGDEKVSFPWFEVKPTDEDAVTAYSHLIYALCEMAKNQNRITATEKEVENEKYAFRCFLLRLGFIGEQYKKERRILLQNLSGSAAFKNNKDKGGAHEVSEQTDSKEA